MKGQVKRVWCMFLVLILIIGMIPCGMPACEISATTANQKKAAIKAYKTMLASSTKANEVMGNTSVDVSVDSCEFALIDINKDGLKEMIVTSDGGYHANILAYVNGKAKVVGGSYASSNSDKYYPNKHIFYTYTAHMGHVFYQYYKFTGKKMKLVAEKHGCDYINAVTGKKKTGSKVSFAPYKYTVKGKVVSKKKYKAYVKKILKGAKSVELKWHKNTKQNRSKYLNTSVKTVKTLKAGKTYSYNLDKKGKKETLSYSMDENATINIKINGKSKKKIKLNPDIVDEAYIQVMDIDKKDKRLDMWVYTYGQSNDITFSALYQYTNKKIKKIWQLKYKEGKMYSSQTGIVLSTDGKGKFTMIEDRALKVDNLVGNHWDKVVFKLKNGKVSRISKKNFNFYLTFPVDMTKYGYENGVPKQQKNTGLILQKNTKFYKKHNKSGGTFVVNKDMKCYPKKVYVASNTRAYVLFETQNGKKGWLCTTDYQNGIYPFSNIAFYD